MVVVAHIPVNVSNIECHGETGHGMEMTDMQGMKHFDARNDVIFCSEVSLLHVFGCARGSSLALSLQRHRLCPYPCLRLCARRERGSRHVPAAIPSLPAVPVCPPPAPVSGGQLRVNVCQIP